jgi:hypothetical protein
MAGPWWVKEYFVGVLAGKGQEVAYKLADEPVASIFRWRIGYGGRRDWQAS